MVCANLAMSKRGVVGVVSEKVELQLDMTNTAPHHHEGPAHRPHRRLSASLAGAEKEREAGEGRRSTKKNSDRDMLSAKRKPEVSRTSSASVEVSAPREHPARPEMPQPRWRLPLRGGQGTPAGSRTMTAGEIMRSKHGSTAVANSISVG
tara:strand:- start:19625 stop:20074 length:450 start_codon:yes stop_codon:yes gene_type:complete